MPKLELESKQALKDIQKEIEKVLHYQGFPYQLDIIKTQVNNTYHKNPLINNSGIERI